MYYYNSSEAWAIFVMFMRVNERFKSSSVSLSSTQFLTKLIVAINPEGKVTD